MKSYRECREIEDGPGALQRNRSVALLGPTLPTRLGTGIHAPMSQTELALDHLDLPPDEVAVRFRWGHRRGHPRYVWPDVPIPTWRTALEAIAEATSRVLSSGTVASASPPSLTLPAGVDAQALGVAAFTSGMGPLLGRWVEEGRLAASMEVAALLDLHLRHGRLRAARAGSMLQDVCTRLEAGDVPVALLKGIQTGTLYFPEPGTRPATDVDLVVPEKVIGKAEAVLEAAGYRKMESWRDPIRSEWMPPNGSTRVPSLEVWHADGPLNVDLHAGFTRQISGLRTLDLAPKSRDDTVQFADLPGRPRGLAPPLLVLTLAAHASEYLEGLKLVRMVELALISRAAGPDGVFNERLLERAHSLDALRFVYPAVAMTDRLVPGTVGRAFLEAARADAPARMIQIVDRLTPGSAQGVKGRGVAELFMAARGPIEHLRRLTHLVLPLLSTDLSPGRIAAFYARRWFGFLGRRRRAGANW